MTHYDFRNGENCRSDDVILGWDEDKADKAVSVSEGVSNGLCD